MKLSPPAHKLVAAKQDTQSVQFLCGACAKVAASMTHAATMFGAGMPACMICICCSCLKSNAPCHICVRLESQQMAFIMLTDSPEIIDVALTSFQPPKGCDSMHNLYGSFPG